MCEVMEVVRRYHRTGISFDTFSKKCSNSTNISLSFTVAAGGSGLSYQWELSTNGGVQMDIKVDGLMLVLPDSDLKK